MKRNLQNWNAAILLLAAMFLSMFSFAQTNAWINEFHYDNDGTDMNEGIEVVIENPGTLSAYTITLYNGNGGGTYNSAITLDQFTVGNTHGNFTIYSFMFPTNGLQNGAPDGFALSYTEK